MFIKSFITKPLAVIFLALFFVFTGMDRGIFFPGFAMVEMAEATSGFSGDKDKDDDLDAFTFNKNDLSLTVDCNPTRINRLQIIYHHSFIATEDASGPNILVVGSDDPLGNGKQCVIAITKISGGNKCGFRVTRSNKKLKIDTINKNNKKNCEMTIKVVAPRNIYIYGG